MAFAGNVFENILIHISETQSMKKIDYKGRGCEGEGSQNISIGDGVDVKRKRITYSEYLRLRVHVFDFETRV